MKRIDKSACLQYLEPMPAPPAGCGLFLLDWPKYIIRSAVKIVGHRRLLILCIYTKGEKRGDEPVLVFTVFQASDTFITYDHRPDAKPIWRTAMLCNLDSSYCPYDKPRFAFYSWQDEKRTIEFCASCFPKVEMLEGVRALGTMQSEIREAAWRCRQRAREKNIRHRLRGLPPLPKDMADWLARDVVPAYFFYDYQKRKTVKKGICSACRQEIELTDVHYNDNDVCPRCGRLLTMKSNGRRGILSDRVTASILQKHGKNELIIRVVKAYSTWFKNGEQVISWHEKTRILIGQAEDGSISTEVYHDSNESLGITPWKHGYPPVMYLYGYNFNAETCGAVYERNLDRVLAGTPWQYCQLKKFYIDFHRENMEVLPYLKAYLEHPRLEHLIKVGFLNLASDLVYRPDYEKTLDECQNRTHQILRVQAEDVPFLLDLDINMKKLRVFQEYCKMNLRGRQELLRWQLQRQVTFDMLQILQYTTVHKMIRFLERQYSTLAESETQPVPARYSSMQDVVREYHDYLEMCVKEQYDMKNSFVLFPRSLQEAHDKVVRRIKQKADAKMRRDFKVACRRIMSQLDYEKDGMKIVYPQTPGDLVAEGNALHHCVGTYADRVARQECIILFLRKCEEENKPFYTIEVRHREVVQVRGAENKGATPEVEKFISQWEKAVLKRPAVRRAA